MHWKATDTDICSLDTVPLDGCCGQPQHCAQLLKKLDRLYDTFLNCKSPWAKHYWKSQHEKLKKKKLQ